MKIFKTGVIGAVALTLLACSNKEGEYTSAVEAEAPADTQAVASVKVESNLLKNAYFGELHLHTSYSLDAYIFGTTLNDPFTAYRFAQGEEVNMPAGGTKRLKAPLDFAAVTDHSEALGEYEICTNTKSGSYNNEVCSGIRNGNMKPFQQIFSGLAISPAKRLESICGKDGKSCVDNIVPPWQRIQQAANEAYKPGEFTTFIAYEYSASAPEGKGGMMHRNVIFRSDQVTDSVFSAFDGSGEDMQVWLEQNCTGDCNVLTIPHNPNFYWGRLYWGKNSDGSELTQEQLERRARMDRLVEIMQVKGNSECQTGIGTTDEECNFEMVFEECKDGEQGGCNDYNAFVRNGLKLGLQQEAKNGINPFKQGFVASTDNHNGTPSDTEESTFQGHYAKNDASPKVRLGMELNATAAAMGMTGDDDPTKLYNPGGIAGVWAESNTREAIWDALHRKETFATSGTRTKIRMFGGFDFADDLHSKENWVEVGYATGVPQGGDLSAAKDKSPSFMVYAERDPNSARLSRLQIIKGWMEGDELKEQTYDVACSDGATPDSKTHRCPDNGAVVDLKDCSISSDKGATTLATTWADPDFDKDERAFYYARVLENPVCRWSMYDAKAAGVEHPQELPKTIKERAWSSPIWYTP